MQQQKVPLWKTGLILGILAACVAMLYPLDQKVKPGLDLAGGTVLVYEVEVPPGVNAVDAVDQTIGVLRKRVDPLEQRGLIWRKLAGDRLEISMPAPTKPATRAREAFDAARDALLKGNLGTTKINAAMRLTGAERQKELESLAGGNAQRLDLLKAYADAYARYQASLKPQQTTQKALNEIERQLLTAAPAQKPALQKQRDALRDETIAAAEVFNEAKAELRKARQALAGLNIEAAEIDRILNLTTQASPEAIRAGLPVNPRQVEIDKLGKLHPDRAAQINAVAQTYAEYEKVKGPLEDPNDLIELLRGSGVLEFRIAPSPSAVPNLMEYTEQLRDKGPRAGADKPFRWFQIDNPESYAHGETPLLRRQSLEAMKQNPQAYFARIGQIADLYGGEIYLLLDNRPDNRMTKAEGAWELTSVGVTPDDYGFPAVAFNLDAAGGQFMSALTGNHIGQPMAIVLDDRVISSPTVQSRIPGSGRITGPSGGFPEKELQYLIRTMRGGALQAKLSERPILIQKIGASFGEDNLKSGMKAAFLALILVGGFMVVYYYYFGAVANFALWANLLIVMGVMASPLLAASYTLPGIAGLVLTIGMAVDANVLIYERIREELARQADLRTAVRLGFDRAMSTIIDSNLTTLITCIILGYTATADIKGFAITLGIGVAANIFTGVFCTHVLIDLYIQFRKPTKMSMLTLTYPSIHNVFTPNIDWYGKRWYFWGATILLTLVGIFAWYQRGEDFLDIEFRGGTQVSFNLAKGNMMNVPEVRRRLDEAGKYLRESLKQTQVGIDRKLAEHPAAQKPVADLKAEKLALSETIKTLKPEEQAQQAKLANQLARLEQDIEIAQQVEQFNEDKRLANTLAGDRCMVVAVGERAGDKAGAFTIATLVTNPNRVSESIKKAFRDVLATTEPVRFVGMGEADKPAPPLSTDLVHRITEADLGANIGRPEYSRSLSLAYDVSDYLGGVAIVVRDMEPAVSLDDVKDRITRMGKTGTYEKLGARPFEVLPLEAVAAGKYRSVAIVARDGSTDYLKNPDTFTEKGGLADTQWALVRDAMLRDTSLESITNFSSQISGTMRTQAIIATVLSWVAIMAYVWIRFGNLRYGLGAVIALIHDVIIAVGLAAAAAFVYNSPTFHGLGFALGLEDFRLNLAMIAAALTLIGYSVNDTIVVFDRIRENRGKLAFATPQIINDSINQTLSRTILTAGTVFISVLVLYVVGGPGVHGFAFIMLIGTLVGCYSSIAVAAPILLLGLKTKIAAQQAGMTTPAVAAPPVK